MSKVVHHDFKKALERYSAEIFSDEMKKYRLETLAKHADDACNRIICLMEELCIENVRCVAIYAGSSSERTVNDDVLKTYFPQQEKEVCNE